MLEVEGLVESRRKSCFEAVHHFELLNPASESDAEAHSKQNMDQTQRFVRATSAAEEQVCEEKEGEGKQQSQVDVREGTEALVDLFSSLSETVELRQCSSSFHQSFKPIKELQNLVSISAERVMCDGSASQSDKQVEIILEEEGVAEERELEWMGASIGERRDCSRREKELLWILIETPEIGSLHETTSGHTIQKEQIPSIAVVSYELIEFDKEAVMAGSQAQNVSSFPVVLIEESLLEPKGDLLQDPDQLVYNRGFLELNFIRKVGEPLSQQSERLEEAERTLDGIGSRMERKVPLEKKANCHLR